TRLIGLGRAKQMIFTADRVDAIKAYEYGILEEVFPKQDLLNQVITYANKIIHNGRLALPLAKEAISQGIDMNLNDEWKLEHEFYKKTIPTEDRMEGLKAFKEKRKPEYKGR